MSEENRQQQSSAESTVAGAAKTGKAIASIAKGAATGGAHGAAVEAAKSSKKWTIPIVAVILLSVLIIAMLPSVIFGSLLGDGTDTPNGISDDTVLVQNLADINSGISMILSGLILSDSMMCWHGSTVISLLPAVTVRKSIIRSVPMWCLTPMQSFPCTVPIRTLTRPPFPRMIWRACLQQTRTNSIRSPIQTR